MAGRTAAGRPSAAAARPHKGCSEAKLLGTLSCAPSVLAAGATERPGWSDRGQRSEDEGGRSGGANPRCDGRGALSVEPSSWRCGASLAPATRGQASGSGRPSRPAGAASAVCLAPQPAQTAAGRSRRPSQRPTLATGDCLSAHLSGGYGRGARQALERAVRTRVPEQAGPVSACRSGAQAALAAKASGRHSRPAHASRNGAGRSQWEPAGRALGRRSRPGP